MNPLISCIMSNYDTAPEMLSCALDSVLNQTFRDFELILIDDRSKNEKSRDVICEYAKRDPRIVPVYKDRNEGLACALNTGLSLARGKYIARFDTDDLCELDRFEQQYKYMETTNCDLSSSFVRLFGNEKKTVASIFTKNAYIGAELFFSCYIYHPSVMFRREFLEENDLKYDVRYEKAEDFDLWVRIRDCGGVICTIPRVLLSYRMHAKSVCHMQKADQLDLTQDILRRQVYNLGIKCTEEEFNIHLILCGQRDFSEKEYDLVEGWCNRLVSQNMSNHMFDRQSFEKVVYNRFFIAVMKAPISSSYKVRYIMKNRKLRSITNIHSILYKRLFGTIHH